MTLEEQIETLANLGLQLNEGITIDDILYSFDREDYENEPFDLIFLILGSEVERRPWNRSFCSRVWNFDVECITESGDYVTIVKRLCEVAGMPNLIMDIDDFVDLESGQAWLKYTIDGQRRELSVIVDNDWADPETVLAVMNDIERTGRKFYAIDNGQASIWFYLDEEIARKINELSNNALQG